MANPSFSRKIRLIKAGTWSATAMALAAMALPDAALAQEQRQSHRTTERSETRSSDQIKTKGNLSQSQNEQRGQRRVDSRQAEQRPAPGWRGRASQAPEGARQQDNIPRKPLERRLSTQSRDEPQDTQRNRSYSDPDRNPTYSSNWRRDAQDNRQDRYDDRRDDRHGWRDGDRDRDSWRSRDRVDRDRADRRWDRDWRRDNRYDWHSYRKSHRHVYRIGRYHPPYSSYRYRRLSIGIYLNSLFFNSRYWIADPAYYRLPPIYGPYKWVRYYEDALLVNIYTGEVVDVIHDFFW